TQGIALIKRRQGKLEESIQLQLEVAQVDPRNEDNWVNLGWTYRGMRRFAEARSMYDRALAIAPATAKSAPAGRKTMSRQAIYRRA
nr:tetratricopeptide repeat protein [Chthoniobacterales bacterium]